MGLAVPVSPQRRQGEQVGGNVVVDGGEDGGGELGDDEDAGEADLAGGLEGEEGDGAEVEVVGLGELVCLDGRFGGICVGAGRERAGDGGAVGHEAEADHRGGDGDQEGLGGVG